MWYDTLAKCVKKEGNLYRVNLICVSQLSRFISDFLFKQVTSKRWLRQFVSWRLSCSTGFMLPLLSWDRTSPSTSSRSDAWPLGSDHYIVTRDHAHLCLCFYLKNTPVQFTDCVTTRVPMTQNHRQTLRAIHCVEKPSSRIMWVMRLSVLPVWGWRRWRWCCRQTSSAGCVWSTSLC